DRKSTRLNSSHLGSSYAVFCLKKKKYSYRRFNHFTPFAHAMFGGIEGSKTVFASSTGGPGIGIGTAPGCTAIVCYLPETAFAMAFGGGVDVKAVNHIWVRVGQVEFLHANLSRER